MEWSDHLFSRIFIYFFSAKVPEASVSLKNIHSFDSSASFQHRWAPMANKNFGSINTNN
jgi:hypothetical protein